MANPNKFFRKYAGILTAVFGVLLMLAFVVADPLSQMINGPAAGGAGDADEVAVEWADGSLTKQQVATLANNRRMLIGFLTTIERVGYETAIAEGNPQPTVPVAPLVPRQPSENIQQQAVQNYLLAEAAREAGMVVSDSSIVAYLKSLGGGKVTNAQIRDIFRGFAGERASVDAIFPLIRDAMLANNYLQSHLNAIGTILPQERYRDWLKVNDRVVVEAAAIPAKSLVGEVPEPTDEELQGYYNEHKDIVPYPARILGVELPAPEPGFKQPRRVVVQFVSADVEAKADELEDDVTDEEIKSFYEENKQLYVKPDDLLGTDLLDDDDDMLSDDAALEDDAADEDDADAETMPAEDGGPPSEEGEEGEEGENVEGVEGVEEVEESEAADEDAGEQPGEDESSAVPTSSPFRLASYQPEEDEGEMAEAEELQGADRNDADDDDPADDIEIEDDAAEEVEYLPLDEVRDEVRQSVARQKASEQIAEQMAELYADLNGKFVAHRAAILDAKDAGEDPPAPPKELSDLESMAKERGLSYAKTEPLSVIELRDADIGRSASVRRSDFERGPVIRLVQAVYAEDNPLKLYEPEVTRDLPPGSNMYLAMKVEDTPETTPPLDKIRDQVVKAWKLEKAAELALERAEALAKKADEAGASLENVAGEGVEVIETAPFSQLAMATERMRPDAQQIPLRMSQPESLEAAGPDLLNAVFDLEEGETTATLNYDSSVAYALRLAKRMSTPEELRQEFIARGDVFYNMYEGMAAARQRVALEAMLTDLLGGEPMEWKVTPDEFN